MTFISTARIFSTLAVLTGTVMGFTGCSSTGGLGLWSPTFPLLPQAKEYSQAAALPTNLPIESCKTVVPNYFVEPGDELLIEPVEYNADIAIPADQIVMIDGTVDLGAFGRIIVAGMTVEQIENVVIERIASFTGERNAVNVRLMNTNAAVVYVLGSVSSPGAYPMNGNETVLDAILRAGGLNSTASPCDIVLTRPTDPCDCRVVLPICYRQITQMGDTTTNYQIQPGDRIYVGGRTLWQEIAFWQQNQTCERCCNSRCMQRDPRAADYRNPICSLPALPPLPFFKKANGDSDLDTEESSDRLELEDLPLDRLNEETNPNNPPAEPTPSRGQNDLENSTAPESSSSFSPSDRYPKPVSIPASPLNLSRG